MCACKVALLIGGRVAPSGLCRARQTANFTGRERNTWIDAIAGGDFTGCDEKSTVTPRHNLDTTDELQGIL